MIFSENLQTQLGEITIFERDGALIRIALHADAAGQDAAERRDTPLIRQAKEQLLAFFAGDRTRFSLPIQPLGTPFQLQVWQALRDIPYGETRTYAQIAAQVQNPRACRAVGGACHANPLLIVIPCHRVIGADGALTGFGAGLAAKEKLLKLENERILRDAKLTMGRTK